VAMSEWTTRVLREIDYTIRARLGDNDCYVDVEAYWIVGEAAPSGALLYPRRGALCGADRPVESIDDAERFMNGHVKWDGCSNLEFDDSAECMLHFCGKQHAVRLGALMGAIYDLAHEILPRPDW
jgi:hypothetical protein